MFIGIQIIDGQELKTLVANTREEIENAPCMVFDRIDEIDWAELYEGVIYTDREELQKAKETAIRDARDALLRTEIDPVVTNALRWADLSDDEKAEYAAYRKYLLDYTETADWWESDPLTMKEWKKERENGLQEEEKITVDNTEIQE